MDQNSFYHSSFQNIVITCFLIAVMQEVKVLDSSVVVEVHALKVAIKREMFDNNEGRL